MTKCHPARSEAESKDPVESLFGFAAGWKAWPCGFHPLRCSLDFARNDSLSKRAFLQCFNNRFFCRWDIFPYKDQLRSARIKRLQLPAAGHEVEKLRAIGKTDETFRPNHAGRQIICEPFKTIA